MSEQEILQKAIEKAIAQGWDNPEAKYIVNNAYDIKSKYKKHESHLTYHQIIFSHDFAKAFFGVQEVVEDSGKTFDRCYEDFRKHDHMIDKIQGYWDEWRRQGRIVPSWKHHLKIMILEENPIQYLEKYL